MEAPTPTPIPTPPPTFKPNTHTLKRNLLKKGVTPTPKILHTLHKKQLQKFNRKSKKAAQQGPPISQSQQQHISQETHFQTIRQEYKTITNGDKGSVLMLGKPWERLERIGFRGLTSGSKEYGGEKLRGEYLMELSEILAQRCGGDKHWLLDEDLEEGEWMGQGDAKMETPRKRQVGDAEAVQLLVKRLSATDLTVKDWKFSKLMKQSGLLFTERHLLKIVEGLGAVGSWKHALSVVEWVYNCDEYKHQKSRFVYTKLLAVLGKARKPNEALHIFNLMREDCRIYPDMPAYHSISVTLGQAGLVKELIDVIECMRLGPSKKVKSMRSKDWDPCFEPNVVVYNAVLNACVSSHHWKGVSWVMEEMRKVGLKPNGASFGLAMEVMLRSRKYDLVHKFFEKMRRSGAVPKAITYKVLVRAFWEEGKVNEAVEAVRDMERRGVVGTASVYYELACCLCKNGRWKEAMVEVEKLKKLPRTKSLEVTFTGMIISCMDGGHVDDCVSVFHEMDYHCSPNIGTINSMLKVYGRNDMFAKAKELFEKTKEMESGSNGYVSNADSSLTPDAFTYTAMLEASASAHQWEYFEYVYKEMALCGCQLDQNKHAWLLVEASKAGKGHLLEHAFEMILEVGEIPHLTFFIEMVCQAASQQNYERAINLLNSMAHASFKISEKQWTEICMGWQNRISKDGLQNLFNELCNSALVSETILSNLSKSLQSICELKSPTGPLELIAFNKVATMHLDDSPDKLEGGKDETNAFSTDTGNLTSRNVPNNGSGIVDHADSSWIFNQRQTTSLCVRPNDMNVSTASSVPMGYFEYSSPSSADRSRNSENIDKTIDLLTSNVEFKSDHLPPASEILKKWKESRNRDSIFLPFE